MKFLPVLTVAAAVVVLAAVAAVGFIIVTLFEGAGVLLDLTATALETS